MIFTNPRLSREDQDQFYTADVYRMIYTPEAATVQDVVARFAQGYALAEEYEPAPFDPSAFHAFSFLDFLTSASLNYESVCEVGAAAGRKLIPFQKMGKRAVGMELSPSLVELGRQRGLDMRQGSAEALTEPYDLIMLLHTLEHVFDPVALLIEFARLGCKYILIEVPGLVDRVPSIQNAHNFYFSKNTLRAVCAKAGWRCLRIDHCRQNDYIFALFEHDGEGLTFTYDRRQEKARNQRVLRRFKLGLLRRMVLQPLGLDEVKVLSRLRG